MDEFNLQETYGSVAAVLYTNEENGYTVLKLCDENGEIITVVGCIPDATVGEEISLQGTWVNHPVHGKQFKAEYAERSLPSSEEGIREYLAGNAIKGIGEATALLIVNRFGADSLNVIECEPERLAEIKGISLSKALGISDQFRRKTGMRRLIEFLCENGCRPVVAMRMFQYYGNDAILLIRQNPFLLTNDFIGGSFSEADTLARNLGFEYDSDCRIRAAIVFEMCHNLANGHCFIPEEALIAATSRVISVETERVQECLMDMIEEGLVISETIRNIKACYLPEVYDDETFIAEKLTQMKDNVMIITGGPGTGKTTSIIRLLQKSDQMGLNFLLTAPTGRAAKRMTEVTGREASTVHRLLGAGFSEDGKKLVFAYDGENRLKCDGVIVDECSMVDVPLFRALLQALPDRAKLVLVGDVDQLPPVGPGNPFKAVIDSEVFDTHRLTEIFRQAQDSRIVQNAHKINRGEYPDFSANVGDFFRLKRLEAASSVETITELFSSRLPGKMGFPVEDIQVLSPTKKGELGTVNLNRELQKILNPPSGEKTEKIFGDRVFRTGDRVMQIKNDYDITWHTDDLKEAGNGIFNGDIGIIRSISPENEMLEVDFDGRIAGYSFLSLNELEHAWAITVHKSQGCEFKAVILALSGSAKMLLTRDVLYTAVTRARELLVLVGDETVARSMIDNSKRSNRYSFLKYRIKKQNETD